MEIQLQELIDQIKKDGVQNAEKEAAAILKKARSEAEKTVADAEAEAKRIISAAKEESDRMVRVGEEAIRQAGRNVLLSFRESVSKELNAVIGESVNNTFEPKTLSELITKVVLAWSENPDTDDISVILNTEDANSLESALLSSLKAHMISGVTLKSSDVFDGGFRISVNGGSAYYDYSAEAVTDMMSSYLSPKVAALLKEASAK